MSFNPDENLGPRLNKHRAIVSAEGKSGAGTNSRCFRYPAAAQPLDTQRSGPKRAIRRHGRRGMTLVEVLFATVILSTMLAAAMNAVGAAAKNRIAQRDSAVGLALARQLLAEVLQTRYKNLINPTFGPESGKTRATYTDVDDYNGLSELDAKNPDGSIITGGAGWSRTVSVQWVTPTDPTVTSLTDQGLKRVTVTVTSPTKKTTSLSGLRSNYDRYEYIPGSQLTYTCWVGVSLQIGTSNTGRSVQGVGLVNMSP